MLRPLKVLVSLIKEDIANGDAAAQRAGVPYYRAAGEKLLEAQLQIPKGQWEKWVEQNVSLTLRTAQNYMLLARRTQDGRHAAVLCLKRCLRLLNRTGK